MVKKNSVGKYILSAGDIATYVVCPHSWYLNQNSEVVEKNIELIKSGTSVHKSWSKNFATAVYFSHSITLLFILIVVTILFFLIRTFHG